MRINSKQLIKNGDSKHELPIITGIKGKKIVFDTKYQPRNDVSLINNDVYDALLQLPDDSIDLVVTSPPYNIIKPYEQKLEFKEYIDWQTSIIKELVRITKSNGSVCWQVGNYIKDKEVFPLDIYFYDIFTKLGLKLRNRIIWHFSHGLHGKNRFSGRYETILWFTLSDEYTFNLPYEVRIDQKYPGKRSYKGPNKGKISGNILGKNPSDLWNTFRAEWEEEVWEIPNVKSHHPEKTIHSSQYPIELVERLILALTNEGDTILDPYVGVGTSLVASAYWDRKGIGIDKEKAYMDIAYERVVSALEGNLKRRPLGKPIYKPSGNEKVAQRPPEWDK